MTKTSCLETSPFPYESWILPWKKTVNPKENIYRYMRSLLILWNCAFELTSSWRMMDSEVCETFLPFSSPFSWINKTSIYLEKVTKPNKNSKTKPMDVPFFFFPKADIILTMFIPRLNIHNRVFSFSFSFFHSLPNYRQNLC